MPNDLAIIKNIRQGDIRAFEHVFRRYYTPLHDYATGLTRRPDIAEEIVQEFFYRWGRDREQITIRRSLGGYIYRCVRNLCLQYLSHRKVQEGHRQRIVDITDRPGPDPHQDLEYRELEKVIVRALGSLPQRRLQIFEMFRHDGKSYREIADTCELALKTIEAEMSKTYKTLRKEIENYYSQ